MIDYVPGRIVEALQLLAADPAEQLGAFPEFVSVADEIAEDFNFAIECIEFQWGERDDVTADERVLLSRLVTLNERMRHPAPGHAEPWSYAALAQSSWWDGVRLEARQILRDLGIRRTPPRDQRSDYVQG